MGQVPTTTIPTLPWIHAMRQQAIHFVNAIRGERTPLCTAEEGLKDLYVAKQYIDALEESEKKAKA
jgi:predicted dehydrogenase